MALFSAVLLNPSSRRSGRKRKGKKKRGAKRGKKMARKRKKRRKRRVKAKRPRRRRRTSRRRRRASATVRVAVANPRRRRRRKSRRRRRRRNPVSIRGRRGKFELLPSKARLNQALSQGAGAVGAEMVRATAYSLIGRTSGSVAEDVLGRLVSAPVAGMLAGYFFGRKVSEAVVDGTYTVTLYKLVADAVAYATKGAPKIAGVLANPFTEVPTKPLIPGLALGGGTAAGVSGLRGLRGVVPERDVLPLGAVVPETNIVPLGEMDGVPERFRSRF